MATAYPFDPTGTSLANRVPPEQHVLTAQNFRDYHYVIPNFAPFFENDFKISLKLPSGTVRTLVYGVDYYFSNKFRDASLACAEPIFGSISFLDTDTFGILTIEYNTVGGIWTLSQQEITRILAEELRNPRSTSWEQITNVPEKFPVIDHEWDLVDMTGAKELVAGINGITDAILQSGTGDLAAHVNNVDNPHQTTKAQVGLSNVQNYGIATIQQAQDGISNSLYMTPLRVADAIASIGANLVNLHANNQSNPHNVTKAQVGLGSVQNYDVATQAQAEAGTLASVYMTALRTKQAIDFQVGTTISTHANNTNNPHNTTKAQVGLNNVQNFSVASQEEAFAGTASDKYMTPQRTRQLVTQYVNTELDGHANRTDNPHSTTATQVGLGNVLNYGVATVEEAQEGSVATKYMTALRTKQAIDFQTGTLLDSHTSRTDNPHAVTKAQVGLSNVLNYALATQTEAAAGTSNTAYMTPLRTKDAIDSQTAIILAVHSGRTDNPHSVTKTQVGLGSVQNYAVATEAEATVGSSNILYMTPLRTKQAIDSQAITAVNSHADKKDNPHEVTATQVGLGNVSNYKIATIAESEAGVATNAYMTPVNVAAAINKLVIPFLNAHTEDHENPHQVNKTQVGLGNVGNYAVASETEASTGVSNILYMTPLRTKQAITAQAGVLVSDHASKKDNPHEVTKAQVGLDNVSNYATATDAEATAANATDKFMTPARVRTAITALATPKAHATDETNPHKVTATQVGAYGKEELDTKLSTEYLRLADTWVSGQPREAFIAEVLKGKSADSAALNGKTLEQVMADTATATSLKSFDKNSTPNPITTPNYWIEIGTVFNPNDENLVDDTSMTSNHPDAYWFLTGGHKQAATDATNAAASSPAYLVHAKNGGALAASTLDITRLNGSANSDVEFGYTTDGVGVLHVWLKVAYAYNSVAVTHLAELGSTAKLSATTRLDTEPTGIIYKVATGGAGGGGGSAELEARVQALEEIINSVTVE